MRSPLPFVRKAVCSLRFSRCFNVRFSPGPSRSDAAVADALCLAVADAMKCSPRSRCARQMKRDINIYDRFIKDLQRHVNAMRDVRMPQLGLTDQQMLDFQIMCQDAVLALNNAKKCQKTRTEAQAHLVDAMKTDAGEARWVFKAKARDTAKRMLKRPAAGLIPIAAS